MGNLNSLTRHIISLNFMTHLPDEREQLVLDALLESFAFDYCVVRLTPTMLDKSIIDAGSALRAYLAQSGLVEFSAIRQGRDFAIEQSLPLVSKSGLSHRVFTFYRPPTKSGDPRFWISKLKSESEPGDLLAILFHGGSLVAINLSAAIETLRAGLREVLPPRYDEFRNVAETLKKLHEKISAVSALGWIPTKRAGDTGIGYTFESLLGIAANSSRDPDYAGIELKSSRLRAGSQQDSLTTLFSKTPNWGSVNLGLGLLQRCGRADEVTKRLSLYCTTTTKANSFALSLGIDPDARRVDLLHHSEPTVWYDFGTLQACLLKKHGDTLFVSARTRGSGASEEFHFDHVLYCSQPSFARFIELMQKNSLVLDLTLSEKASGSTRDHGYLWRIRKSQLSSLFGYQRVLM